MSAIRYVPALLVLLLPGCHSEESLASAASAGPSLRQADETAQFSDWSTPVNLGPAVKHH